jgi:hypothetical protein
VNIIHDDGGWISGAMKQAQDTRPEYSPTSLLLDVRAVLERAGIQLAEDDARVYTATIAAADLLQALGVKPVTAPGKGVTW